MRITPTARQSLIVIERPTVDETGVEPVTTWNPLATVWAELKDVSAGEAFRAQQVGATLTTRFLVRWNPTTAGIRASDRIQCDGQVFNITGSRVTASRRVEIDAARAA